jgi:hypothetical protein
VTQKRTNVRIRQPVNANANYVKQTQHPCGLAGHFS